MKIIVLVKAVPDTYGDRKLDLTTGLAERDAGDTVLDEIGERALEAALTYADGNDAEVVVMSMGPESAVSSVRKGLAMGASSAVHIMDAALAGADAGFTAEVLATAIQREGFDLVVTGNLSTDGSAGVIPAMIAEILGVPQATSLSSLDIAGDRISGTRVADDGVMTVSSSLPAVVSVTEALPDARFPSFKGIMAAKKKPYRALSLADLGLSPDSAEAARSIVVAISRKPPRDAGVKIVDEGDAGAQLAEFLVSNRLA